MRAPVASAELLKIGYSPTAMAQAFGAGGGDGSGAIGSSLRALGEILGFPS